MLSNDQLDAIADAVDPLLLLLTLALPVLASPRLSWWQRIWFYLAAGIGIGNVYLWRWLDEIYRLWPSVGLDYSTHTALAVTLIVSLAELRRRWLCWLLPLLFAYAILMRYLNYHSFMDVFTTTAVIVPFTYFIHKVNKKPLPLSVHDDSA
jgi:TRAP-type uncharacterized transport system fused permease subunit